MPESLGQLFPNDFTYDGLETLLEKTIEYFNKNVSEIESAIARDADIAQLQKLDESLNKRFQEIQSFQTDNQRLRRIQLNFFLDYISKLSENPLVSELAETTRGLIGLYLDEAAASPHSNGNDMRASNENIRARY